MRLMLRMFCLVFSDESLVTHAALREERADNGREHGDDELNNGLPGLEFLEHNLEVKSEG